jgi:hypothetical protein
MMTGDAELRIPAPARALAGLNGVQTKSDIRLIAAPDDPHRLDVMFAFPDRQRWTLSRESALNDRLIQLRFGEHGFQVEVGDRDSRAMREAEEGGDPGERLEFLRRCALRQAAFLWPEGARWKGDGARREAPIYTLEPDGADEPPPASAIGSLVATVGADGRLSQLTSRDAQGTAEETLEFRAWQTVSGREWPANLRLAVRGVPVWDERVREVEPTVRFADRAFVPSDRAVLLREYAEPLRVRLGATVRRRYPLEPPTSWPAALERAEHLRRSAAAALPDGVALAPEVWLELGDGGEPRGVVLELAGAPEEPPAGWKAVPAVDAVVLELEGLDPPAERARTRLAGAIPAGREAAAWSARVGARKIRLQAVLR